MTCLNWYSLRWTRTANTVHACCRIPKQTALALLVILFLSTLLTHGAGEGYIKKFEKGFRINWGSVAVNDDTGVLKVELTKGSGGGGWQSHQPFIYGWYGARVQAPAGYSAGAVTAIYLHSEWNMSWADDFHDEIDFELLGTDVPGEVLLQTNWYADGIGGHEERMRLWFDPTAGLHEYSFQVNREAVRWFVDGVMVRELLRSASPLFPSTSLFLFSSLWDGSAWATKGGRVKMDWALGPYHAFFAEPFVDGCYWRQNDEREAPPCSQADKFFTWDWRPGPEDLQVMRHARERYLTYSYATDPSRKPWVRMSEKKKAEAEAKGGGTGGGGQAAASGGGGGAELGEGGAAAPGGGAEDVVTDATKGAGKTERRRSTLSRGVKGKKMRGRHAVEAGLDGRD